MFDQRLGTSDRRIGVTHRMNVAGANLLVLLTFALAACGGGGSAESGAVVDESVTVTPSNIVLVQQSRIEAGPSISGSLEPERSATISAQVGGSIVQVLAERGQSVGRGALLARLNDNAIRDAFLSARSAVTTAEQAAALARRDAERAQRLAEAGGISERDLETAKLAATNAAGLLADARARLALAQEQVRDTEVRSPMSGIVSERPVNAGDVVQPGTPLFTVVDPSSMRLQASVPATQFSMLRVGSKVEFTVRGYPNRVFTGKIDRINPTADPATGMVALWATLPNTGGTLVGGLFAEGRVATESRETLVVPLNAIEHSAGGTSAYVVRVKGGKVERVPVNTGIRDEQAERVEILSGVALGDTLLVGASRSIPPGTPVRVQVETTTRTTQ